MHSNNEGKQNLYFLDEYFLVIFVHFQLINKIEILNKYKMNKISRGYNNNININKMLYELFLTL